MGVLKGVSGDLRGFARGSKWAPEDFHADFRGVPGGLTGFSDAFKGVR